MRDSHIAVRENERLWNVALDVNVRRLDAKLRGIKIPPHGNYEVEWLLKQRLDNAGEYVRLVIRYSAERHIYGRAIGVRKVFNPGQQGLVAIPCVIKEDRAQGVSSRRQLDLRILVAGRHKRQV